MNSKKDFLCPTCGSDICQSPNFKKTVEAFAKLAARKLSTSKGSAGLFLSRHSQVGETLLAKRSAKKKAT